MIKQAIQKLTRKEDIGYDMAKAVMHEMMSGEVSQIQMSAYLMAMSLKGETIEEITGSAASMREHCVRLLHEMDVLEIVGTGGDESHSFNISTTAAIVAAAAGVPVAKHGNRAASSLCGAADVLEALGVNISVPPELSAHMLEEIGICFLFAQNYHIAMKYVAPVRRELGIRTLFNILGPLVNPAGANMELLGVYDAALVEPLAQVLYRLGVKSALVVYGLDGLDEISVCAPTLACEVRHEQIRTFTLEPEQFGLARCPKEDLTGGAPSENAAIIRAILKGEKGPKRDAVLLNAAAALYIADACDSIQDGIHLCESVIDSGQAFDKLSDFIAYSNETINTEKNQAIGEINHVS